MAAGAAIMFEQLSDVLLPTTMLVLCFFAAQPQAFIEIVLGGRYFSKYSVVPVCNGSCAAAVTVVDAIEEVLKMAIELRAISAVA